MSDEAQEHVVVSELEAEAARRERAPESLSALIDERVLGERNGDVGTSWRTLRTWLAVNGSTERAHTTGVFVEPPRVPGAPPALVVYVDTKACEVDFRANAEVYLRTARRRRRPLLARHLPAGPSRSLCCGRGPPDCLPPGRPSAPRALRGRGDKGRRPSRQPSQRTQGERFSGDENVAQTRKAI